jgi:hypothetical protein
MTSVAEPQVVWSGWTNGDEVRSRSISTSAVGPVPRMPPSPLTSGRGAPADRSTTGDRRPARQQAANSGRQPADDRDQRRHVSSVATATRLDAKID